MVDVADVHLPAGFIRAVAAATDHESVLRAAATWMPRIIQAERSSVALPFDDDHLSIRSIGGVTLLTGPQKHAIADSIVGEAYLSQKILVIDDLFAATQADAHALRKAGLRSAVVGPMISGGRCLGTINLANSQPGFFDDAHRLLLGSVADLIASFLNVHQLAQVEKDRAATDDLTGTLSRRAALAELERIFHAPQGRPSVLFIDLDGFKRINDSHGHRAGDEVLRQLTRRIEPLLGPEDRLGRLGGDEFLVIVHADPAGERAEPIARALLNACALPIVIGAVQVQPRLSIGLAYPQEETTDATTLLGDADHAMYTAKADGSSLVVADQDIRRQVELVATIDRDLDAAMEAGDILFHYQPIRHLSTREIKGAEALVRWTHPEFGPIPPPLLIERVEATGRTAAFTTWSLGVVAGNLAQIRNAVPRFHDKAFSFNLTPGQLSWSGCARAHLDTCERHGFAPSDLLVEVVESSAIQPDDPAEQTLRQLAAAGASIALDDFGVGHNALAYFTRFPIHALKLDQSLVRGMEENAAARSILRGLTSMARELGIIAVAEGVETEVEESMCREAGIDQGQGWHFGRPAPIAQFIERAADELGGMAELAA